MRRVLSSFFGRLELKPLRIVLLFLPVLCSFSAQNGDNSCFIPELNPGKTSMVDHIPGFILPFHCWVLNVHLSHRLCLYPLV